MPFPGIQLLDSVVRADVVDGSAVFTYDGKKSLTINVLSNTSAVVRLLLEGSGDPRFLSNPFDWFAHSPAEPVPTPASLSVQRNDSRLCTLVDYNAGDTKEVFRFTLSVQIDGRIYTSSDPTIINHKPE